MSKLLYKKFTFKICNCIFHGTWKQLEREQSGDYMNCCPLHDNPIQEAKTEGMVEDNLETDKSIFEHNLNTEIYCDEKFP